MKTYLFNYTEENPLIVNDYPYGIKLRTQIKYWIETAAKKGDRFCSQTLNPKNGRWNAPKKSTFSVIGVMFNDEKGHTHWEGISQYSSRAEVSAFIDAIGGADKLNAEQRKQFNSMMGINEVKRDEFSGEVKKDFKVQWEKNHDGSKYHSVRITFDRPDGVSVREIFKAVRTLNQERLNECFEGYDSPNFGRVEGFVRICMRGGVQITTVQKDAYREYLAMDETVLNEE